MSDPSDNRNYGKQLEFFADFILERLLEYYVTKGVVFSSPIGPLKCIEKVERGTADGGTQISDIWYTLKFENGAKFEIILESKAYFALSSKSDDTLMSNLDSLLNFETMLVDEFNKSIGNLYVIFRPGEDVIKKGTCIIKLKHWRDNENYFPDNYCEFNRNNFGDKVIVQNLCEIIEREVSVKDFKNVAQNQETRKRNREICTEFLNENTDIRDGFETHMTNYIQESINMFFESPLRVKTIVGYLNKQSIHATPQDTEDGFMLVDTLNQSQYDQDLQDAVKFHSAYHTKHYKLLDYPSLKVLSGKIEDDIYDSLKLYYGMNSSFISGKLIKYLRDEILSYMDSFQNSDTLRVEYLLPSPSEKLGIIFHFGSKKKLCFQYSNKGTLLLFQSKDELL